jgi:hypothetical protein
MSSSGTLACKAIPSHKHFLYGVALPVSSVFGQKRRGLAEQLSGFRKLILVMVLLI